MSYLELLAHQEKCMMIRIFNAGSINEECKIQPIPLLDGSYPILFPKTKQEFRDLSIEKLNSYLQFYTLSQEGTDYEKLSTLAFHLGIRL